MTLAFVILLIGALARASKGPVWRAQTLDKDRAKASNLIDPAAGGATHG